MRSPGQLPPDDGETMNLKTYRILTSCIEPLLPWWLLIRRLRGKEDPARLRERYGHTLVARPSAPLIWFHAASVGEATSLLVLIAKIRLLYPYMAMMVTTGTVTSAQLMAARLPQGVIHQYAPLDTQDATRRFMYHWRPQFAFFIESELWPNLIDAADFYQCFMGILNGRMSERSFASWQKRPEMIRDLLSRFNCVYAQSEIDAARFRQLGARHSECVGNLKYDASMLPCDESELLALKKTIASRPHWLAASTHPGEETMIAEAHALIKATRPSLLTVIVPRHPARGAQLAGELGRFGRVSLRSRQEKILPDTDFYIADTLGELGLFYRLSDIVLMGGSLVPHGGQNPLEAARLSCAIVTGPHVHNFEGVYSDLAHAEALLMLDHPKELPARIASLLGDSATRDVLGKNARMFVDGMSGTSDRLLESLGQLFESVR